MNGLNGNLCIALGLGIGTVVGGYFLLRKKAFVPELIPGASSCDTAQLIKAMNFATQQ